MEMNEIAIGERVFCFFMVKFNYKMHFHSNSTNMTIILIPALLGNQDVHFH